jgi:hypothetical protein
VAYVEVLSAVISLMHMLPSSAVVHNSISSFLLAQPYIFIRPLGYFAYSVNPTLDVVQNLPAFLNAPCFTLVDYKEIDAITSILRLLISHSSGLIEENMESQLQSSFLLLFSDYSEQLVDVFSKILDKLIDWKWLAFPLPFLHAIFQSDYINNKKSKNNINSETSTFSDIYPPSSDDLVRFNSLFCALYDEVVKIRNRLNRQLGFNPIANVGVPSPLPYGGQISSPSPIWEKLNVFNRNDMWFIDNASMFLLSISRNSLHFLNDFSEVFFFFFFFFIVIKANQLEKGLPPCQFFTMNFMKIHCKYPSDKSGQNLPLLSDHNKSLDNSQIQNYLKRPSVSLLFSLFLDMADIVFTQTPTISNSLSNIFTSPSYWYVFPFAYPTGNNPNNQLSLVAEVLELTLYHLLQQVILLQRGLVHDVSVAIPNMIQMRYAFNYFLNNAVSGLLYPLSVGLERRFKSDGSKNGQGEEINIPYDIHFIQIICKKIKLILN